jgi:hypothetical protein
MTVGKTFVILCACAWSLLKIKAFKREKTMHTLFFDKATPQAIELKWYFVGIAQGQTPIK